jgi:hypothetical protein
LALVAFVHTLAVMAVIVSVSMELAPLGVYDLAIAIAIISWRSALIGYFWVEYSVPRFVHSNNCNK